MAPRDLGQAGGRVRHILAAIPWWTAYVMGLMGMLAVGVPALIDPDRFEVTIMLIIAIAWIVVCAAWARLAKSSIRQSKETLTELEHMFLYVRKMNGTLHKSLDALATYDRDLALELAEELNMHTTKSLYDAYWRDPSAKETDA